MHLNFLNTSPLKEFASGLRSKPKVCNADQLLAELTITNTKDRRLLLAVLAACMPSMPSACTANMIR
jgi:hypothetical protein